MKVVSPVAVAAKAFDTVQADTYFYVPFGKTVLHDDGTLTVSGKASSETLDSDGQIVDRDLIKRLLPKWAAFGAVREMHQPKAVGTREDHYYDEDGDPVVVARVVDPDAVKKVQHGVLQGFSVGLHRPKTRYDKKAPKGRIYDAVDMPEISLVDRPANPDCRFSVLKMLSPGEWLDCQKGVAFRDSDVPDGIAHDERDARDADRARQGDIQDPWSGNSADAGADQTPLLQPAQLHDNADSVRVVSLDDRAAIVRMDGVDWVCPYTVDGDGVHVDMEAAHPLPQQMRAEAPPPEGAAHEMPPLGGTVVRDTEIGKGAEAVGASVARDTGTEEGAEKADDKRPPHVGLSAEDKSKFLSQAKKDSPVHIAAAMRRLSEWAASGHFPAGLDHGDLKWMHDEYVKILHERDPKSDASHDFPAAGSGEGKAAEGDDVVKCPSLTRTLASVRDRAEPGGERGGEKVAEPAKTATVHDIREAATKAAKETAHCAECGKRVKCMEKVDEKAMSGGKFARYKGACGHTVGRFEPEERKAAEPGGDRAAPAKVDEPAEGDKTAAVAAKAEDGDKGTAPQEAAVSAEIERLEADLKRLKEKQRADEAGAKAAEPEGDKGARGDDHPDGPGEDDEEKMAEKMARILGMTPRQIARAARQRHREGLIETLTGMLERVKAIPDEPSYAGKAASLGNVPVKPQNAPERNDGGPAPAESGDWVQRIREDVSEVHELVRMLERSEGGLVHGDDAPPSRVAREIGSSPQRKPAGPTMNQRLDDLPTPRGEQDFGGKGAGFTAEQVQEIATKAAAAAAAAVGEQLAATQKRLGVVEHMARPAGAPAAPAAGFQEASSVAPFASPEQFTRDRLGIDSKQLQSMSEAQRERMLTTLIGQRLGTTPR